MVFADGIRVRILPHFWWPQGAVGTVRPFPGVLQGIPHVQEQGGMAVNPDGCTRPFRDTAGQRMMVWVMFDEPTTDCEGAGLYTEGEILSQYLEPVEAALEPENPRWFPGKTIIVNRAVSEIAPIGSILIEKISWDINSLELHKPDDSDFGFWEWLVRNADLFPELNERNMASAQAGYALAGREAT